MSDLRKAAYDAIASFKGLRHYLTLTRSMMRLEAALVNEPDLRKLVRTFRDAEYDRAVAEQGGALSEDFCQLRVAELNARTAMFLAVEEADNE